MNYSVRHRQSLQHDVRRKILDLAYQTHSGHIGSCLSCVDLLSETLLFAMKKNDSFILSKGHAALTLYIMLYHKGALSKKTLMSYLQDGTYLGIHPSSAFPKHIPLATGSLGHGLSFACGLAKGYILKNKNNGHIPFVYCLISDAETNEGSIWEAAQFASAHSLDNLIVLVDKNDMQAMGKPREILGDTTTKEHWESVGWHVLTCNGHDTEKISKTMVQARENKSKAPTVILCRTVLGKGVGFMEDKLEWHYKKMDEKTYKEAVESLASSK